MMVSPYYRTDHILRSWEPLWGLAFIELKNTRKAANGGSKTVVIPNCGTHDIQQWPTQQDATSKGTLEAHVSWWEPIAVYLNLRPTQWEEKYA